MNKDEIAATTFGNKYNCAQAVFSTFAEELGLDREIALKIACPYGAGMGKMQETCGAVTGAFMVLGLKYGKSNDGEDDKKALTYEMVNNFVTQFKARNKSIKCIDILGYDMKTEEGYKQIEKQDMFNTTCVKMVKDAVQITEKLLNKIE